MSDWLLIVLLILTVYRVTRLVIADSFPPIAVPRDKLLNWWGTHWGAFGRSLAYLFTCPWCMSVWLGGGMIWALDYWWRPIPAPLLVWAAASALTGLMSAVEDKLSS